MIELAWKGWCEQREQLERMIYGAQGIKLPPPPSDDDAEPVPMAAKWRIIARDHNAHWRAKQRALARRGDPAPPTPSRKRT